MPLLATCSRLDTRFYILEVRLGPLRFEGVREWDSVPTLGIEYSTIGL